MDKTMLANMATKTEKKLVFVDYDKEQISNLKDELIDKLHEINSVEDSFDAVKNAHKSNLKNLKTEKSNLLQQIREGRTKVEDTLLYVPNFEDGLMEIYRESNGELYESRKLRPDERQMSFNLSIAN